MSLIELACRDASCAPPPVGTGGSSPAITTSSGSELYAAVKRLEADGAITPSTRAPLTSGPEGLFRGMSRTDLVDTVLDYGGNINSIELRPHVTKGVAATQQYLKDRFGEGARVILFRGTDNPGDPFRETMRSANQATDEGPSGLTSWTAIRSLAEGYGSTVTVAAVPIDRILSWDWMGTQADSTMLGYEVIVGTAEGVRKAAAGEFPAMERLRPTTASALIELACHSKDCAPPPTGTGGSSPIDDLADLPEGFVTDGEEAARRVFEFEFTDRGGRKFIAKTDNVEESDAGVVTIEGTIFAPVPIGGGRLRQHAVGYFTRQVDGWRMHHDSLSIMPQHQGKGIGSAFIAESMRRAADEGVTQVSVSALSTKTSNGVYTWLRAGFDTPSGNLTAVTTRKRIANRIEALGGSAFDTPSVKLASKLRGRETVTTAELLSNPRSREFLGQSGGGALQMELQMDISDLRTEAALAASVFTDWVERAITFTLAEDETWYEPLADAELTAAGCQSADCAPPPVGTGGSAPGADLPGIVDWVSGTENDGEIPVFDPDSDAGKLILSLANEFRSNYTETPPLYGPEDLAAKPIRIWTDFTMYEESRMWLSATVRAGADPTEQVLLGAIHENWLRRWDPKHLPDAVPVYRSVDGDASKSDPYEPNAGWKADSVAPDEPGTGLTSWFWGRGRGVADSTPWGHGVTLTEPSESTPWANRAWYGDVDPHDVLGVFGDMSGGIGHEIIVGRPGLVERLLKGVPSERANAPLRDVFAGLEVYGFSS